MLSLDEYYGFDICLGGGIRINNQIAILLQFNYLKSVRDNKFDKLAPIEMMTTSISGSYRFLKPNHIVSPVIELDAGVHIWSNADDLFIDQNFYIHKKQTDNITQNKFYNNSIIGKTKLLLNVNIKSVDFNIGASYNTYFFHLSGVYGGTVYSLEKGLGFEAQVLYTFPMKKRSLDKLENR